MLNIFIAYSKNRSVAVRNRLVEMNAGLAHSVTKKFARIYTNEFEDLLQVAYLGLIAAVEGFDPSLGYQFSSYAVPRIEGKIKQYLRDKASTIRIPQPLQELQYKKVKAESKLRVLLKREPSIEETAQFLEISVDRLLELESALLNRNLISLHSYLPDSNEIRIEDTIQAPEHEVVELLPMDSATEQPINFKSVALLNSIYLTDSTCKSVADKKRVSSTTIKKQLRQAVREFAAS